jgi:hypothetical protein
MSKPKRTRPISHALGLSLMLMLSGLHTPAAAQKDVPAHSPSGSSAASAVTIVATLSPSKDNTLFEELDGALSNGAGPYFFVGSTAQSSNTLRRGLIRFDITSTIPSFATVVSATLHLNMSQTAAGPQPVRLHRATADWGEGASNAGGQGGGGAPSLPGDATWVHRFFSTEFWNAAGGDFVITPSVTTTVDAVGAYTWRDGGMLADIGGWLSAPATNFGWVLLGNETSLKTAKRFNSREHPSPSARPALVITYTVPHAAYLPMTLRDTQVITP